jgi:hypothetical protein
MVATLQEINPIAFDAVNQTMFQVNASRPNIVIEIF